MTEPIDQTMAGRTALVTADWRSAELGAALQRRSEARPPTLVCCSHGTDSTAGRAAIRSIITGVRRARPDLDVREAFVDVQDPKVADVVRDACSAGGSAVVVPLFLSIGYHVHVDISAAVANRPAVATAPLGPDARLVEILLDRLVAAGADRRDAVVLAAAGSTDERAVVAVEEIAARLRTSWGSGAISIGYGAGATPRVPDAVTAALTTAGTAGVSRVLIASYLLAPGFFHDRLLAAGADLVTDPLAPDSRLVEIVLDRYGAAITGAASDQARPGR